MCTLLAPLPHRVTVWLKLPSETVTDVLPFLLPVTCVFRQLRVRTRVSATRV